MRKMQAELSFDDASYKVSRAMVQLSEARPDFSTLPMPRSRRIKVTCLECSYNFSTCNAVPSCPNCGGSDVDLA